MRNDSAELRRHPIVPTLTFSTMGLLCSFSRREGNVLKLRSPLKDRYIYSYLSGGMLTGVHDDITVRNSLSGRLLAIV